MKVMDFEQKVHHEAFVLYVGKHSCYITPSQDTIEHRVGNTIGVAINPECYIDPILGKRLYFDPDHLVRNIPAYNNDDGKTFYEILQDSLGSPGLQRIFFNLTGGKYYNIYIAEYTIDMSEFTEGHISEHNKTMAFALSHCWIEKTPDGYVRSPGGTEYENIAIQTSEVVDHKTQMRSVEQLVLIDGKVAGIHLYEDDEIRQRTRGSEEVVIGFNRHDIVFVRDLFQKF